MPGRKACSLGSYEAWYEVCTTGTPIDAVRPFPGIAQGGSRLLGSGLVVELGTTPVGLAMGVDSRTFGCGAGAVTAGAVPNTGALVADDNVLLGGMSDREDGSLGGTSAGETGTGAGDELLPGANVEGVDGMGEAEGTGESVAGAGTPHDEHPGLLRMDVANVPPHGAQLVAQGAQLVAQGEQPVAHGAQLVAQGLLHTIRYVV